MSTLPKLGLGLGLRNSHFEHILKNWPDVDWFEAISENFMDSGGRPRAVIRQMAERYPVVLHGVSLSIGSTDPLNFDYLNRLKKLALEIQPAWVSDHLCWTGMLGINSHDLLPLPLTEATFKHVAERVSVVQDFLQRPLVLENPSSYISFAQSNISEPDFLRQLAQKTGCKLLLDVNNVYVTCFNSDNDPHEYLEAFPCEHVVQIHLAGHQHCGTHIIDTHDQPVKPAVWALYRLAWVKTGGVASLLEGGGNIPAFEDCHAELMKAKQYMNESHFTALGCDELNNPNSHVQAATVSTPIDFMVPEVMDSTVLEQR